MSNPIYQVDAFTNEPFKGNPAAVCVLDEPGDEVWMQNVAAEMNLSETAFLVPRGDGWALRWFTPTVEVKLCGHATLASAHVLWEAGYLAQGKQARFHTASGLLTAKRDGDWIELDFPAQPVKEQVESPQGLADVFGEPVVAAYHAGWTQLVEMESESAIRRMSPDFVAIKASLGGSAMVTAASDSPDYDFVSRFFAPGVGIDEDPVTGSAHCTLGPYWAQRLGKDKLVARQISARGGVVKVVIAGDRVKLAGQAVTTLRGELV